MKKNKQKLLILFLGLGMLMGTVSAKTTYEDFEDISEWTGDTGNFNKDNGLVYEGTFSGRLNETGTNAIVSKSLSQSYSPTNFKAWMAIENGANQNGNEKSSLSHYSGSTVVTTIALKETGSGLEAQAFDGSWNVIATGLSEQTFYKYNVTFDWANNQYSVEVFDTNGNSLGSASGIGFRNSASSFDKFELFQDNGGSDDGDPDAGWYDLFLTGKQNSAPSIDSTNLKPSNPQFKSEPDYQVNASDSDGNDLTAHYDLKYWNNGSVFDSGMMSEPTANDFELRNPYTVNVVNDGYNLTVDVSDGSTNTSTTISHYVEDSSPGLVINKPSNTTFFDYDQNWKISNNDDGDDVSETSECKVWDNGNLIDTLNLDEGTNSGSNSFRHDKGFHELNATCTEQNGSQLTTNKQRYYRVKRFELTGNNSASPVFETVNETYSSSYQVGDMVNTLKAYLWWDGNRKHTTSTKPSGITSFTLTNFQEIPLVSNNATTKNWHIAYEANYTSFSGNSYTVEQRNSTTNKQSVRHGYYIKNNFTEPRDGDYIETENLIHNVTVAKQNEKPVLSGTTTYNRNSNTTDMKLVANRSNEEVWEGSLDVGIADNFNKSTFTAESKIKVKFNGDSRTINSGKVKIQVHRIQLFPKANPGSLNTAKTLVFDTDYEENGYNVKTDLRMDLSVWKNRDEKIRRFSYQTTGEKHEFHIYPSWAKYKMRTLPYKDKSKFDIIQYEPTYTGGNLRSHFFPTTQTLTNTVTDIPLKTINDTETTQIDIEITDANGDPAPNTYCRFDRKFPGTGKHQTVFMILTGSEGKSQSFAEINEIFYRIICFKDGEQVDSFGDQILEDPLRLSLGAGDTQTALDYSSEFDSSCTDTNFGVECSYQSQTGKLNKVELTVERQEVVQDVTVCQKTGTTSTGTLNCSKNESFNGNQYFINGSKNRYTYNVKAYFPGDIQLTGATGQIGDLTSDYGKIGIIVTAVMFMFVLAASAFNVVAGIALGTLTILFSSTMKLIILTPTQTASLVALTIVIGWVLTK